MTVQSMSIPKGTVQHTEMQHAGTITTSTTLTVIHLTLLYRHKSNERVVLNWPSPYEMCMVSTLKLLQKGVANQRPVTCPARERFIQQQKQHKSVIDMSTTARKHS